MMLSRTCRPLFETISPALVAFMLVLAACGPTSPTPAQGAEYQPPESVTPAAAAVPSVEPTSDVVQPPSTPAAAAAAPRLPVPTQLVIPAIGIDASVEQLGLTTSNAMEAPKEWADVGWFSLGYRPGEAGNAVIAGHLDSTTGPAVFWNLNKLRPGDPVIVKAADNSERRFAVMSSEKYAVSQAPLGRIFGPAPASNLNLVTCNGAFDRNSKEYDQRLVVYAAEIP